MKNENKVSIVITTFNRSRELLRAVNSALNQTYPFFEIIVMDNCSTDNTEELIKNIQDSRIVYYKNKNNIGGHRNKAEGLKKAEGKYIVFLDDDDYYTDERWIENAVSVFEKEPGVSAVLGDSFIWNINTNKTSLRKICANGVINNKYYSDFFEVKFYKPNSTFTTIQKSQNFELIKELESLDDIIFFTCALIMGNLYVLEKEIGIYSFSDLGGTFNLDYSFIECNYYGLEKIYNKITKEEQDKFYCYFKRSFKNLCICYSRSKKATVKGIFNLLFHIISSNSPGKIVQIIYLFGVYFFYKLHFKKFW